MKTRLCLMLGLLAGGGALAEDAPFAPGPPTVSVSRVVSGGAESLHAFGGGPLAFTVAVDAPLGTHLRVLADVIQRTGGTVAATLRQNVPVSPELVFDGCTHMAVPCTLPALETVKRRTGMMMTLHTDTRPPGSGGDGGTLSVPMVVYPREERDGWRKMIAAELARSGLRRMAVFGKGMLVKRFLRERKVTFEDVGEDWPGQPDAHTLYVGDVSDLGEATVPIPKWVGESPGMRLVLFAPSSQLPGVYRTLDAVGGGVWKVKLPNLFSRPDDDPQGQEIVAEIFRQALEPRANPLNESTTENTATP